MMSSGCWMPIVCASLLTSGIMLRLPSGMRAALFAGLMIVAVASLSGGTVTTLLFIAA